MRGQRPRGLRMALTVSAALMVAQPRQAQASLLGEENAWLAQLVGLKLEELTQISILITNARLMLGGINELAAGARQAYRIYDMVRNYSLDDLWRDAKRGLMQAFPELRDVEREVDLLRANRKAYNNGRFLTHVDLHDDKMRRTLEATFRYAYRASVWPRIFPEGVTLPEDPSDVDLLVHSRYERAGMQMRTAVQNTALGILANKAAALVQDAEDKGRADQQAAALNAQVNAQTTNNTTQLVNLAELEAAEKESGDKALEAFEQATKKELAESTEVLMRAGVVR